MSLRLLSLVCLISVSQLSLSQQAPAARPRAPETCPVTKPADRPFVPPSPYPAQAPMGSFWFGTDRLWTVWRLTRMVAGGITQALPSMEVQFGSVACTRTPADRGIRGLEKPGILLRRNHSLTVRFSRAEDETHRGGRCFPPRLYFRLEHRGPSFV